MKNSPVLRVSAIMFCVFAVVAGWTAFTAHGGGSMRMPIPHDWSHKHMVFSPPTHLAQAWKLQQDQRYWQQVVRRNAARNKPAQPPENPWTDFAARKRHPHPTSETQTAIHRDWSVNLGNNGTAGAGQYPAKFNFDVSTADCTNDFVVFNSGVPAANASTASDTLTFTGNPTNGQAETITNGANSLTVTASVNTTATGTITVTTNSDPRNWAPGSHTVTVGSTTYTFVTALVNPNDVLIVGNSTAANDRTRTARNLRAAIDANAAQCFTSPCFGAGTAANSSVTATVVGRVVTATSRTEGAAGDFTLTSNNGTDLAIGGGLGSNGAGSNTGTNFLVDGNTTNNAANLAAAINRNVGSVGVTASSAGAAMTVTDNTAGSAGDAITHTNLTNATWASGGNNLTGGADAHGAITAFNNLYAGGCSGTVPSVYWQYNLGAGVTVTTSVTLSGDGSQIAFVENSGGTASLVLLKWAASASLATPSNVAAGSYRNCTAPCMTTFSLGATDTNSAPYYVFTGPQADSLYVGDDGSVLHKFTGVFLGTPAAVGAPWPITVNGTAGLTSPVYDNASGNIYVGDNTGGLSFVRDVGSTVGTCTAPCKDTTVDAGNNGAAGTRPMSDAPIVDSSTGRVFAFMTCENAGSGCGNVATPASVVQYTTALTGKVIMNIGINSATDVVFAGSFDNNYYSGNYATGSLYACGDPDRLANRILYRMGFDSSGVLNGGTNGTATTILSLTANSTTNCSGVTELMNGNEDRIFLSVTGSATPTNCAAGGCIMSFNITSWQPGQAYAVNDEVLDSNLNIQVVTTAGTSGGAAPAWNAVVGGVTSDNGVQWVTQGSLTSTWALANWQANHSYAANSLIIDSNGNLERSGGSTQTSGASQPTWNTAAGGTTSDGGVTWTNLGLTGSATLAATGGTSGIIIDNTVGSGVMAGASQVYYTTLGNQACNTGGTGGCAVQATQSGLD